MQDNAKTVVQLEAVKAWAENKKIGTIVMAPGFGKSRIGVTVAAEQLSKGSIRKVLIVVPTVALVDQWRKEFEKWGYESTKVDIWCLKTAYKTEEKYDLLIVDECHRSLSPEYRRLYENIQYEQVLGLTGTPPENKEYLEFLNKVAPIVYTKDTNDALELGAIADYVIYNLEVPMSRKNRARYRTFDGKLKRAQMEIGILKRYDDELKDLPIFEIAQKYVTFKDKNLLTKWSKEFWSSMSMRKWECYQNEGKVEVVKNIINKFPNRKWILFNKSIKFAELLHSQIPHSMVYHSKMKKEAREEVLNAFSTNACRYLIAVDALNEGLNVPDADSAICVSGVSTELVQAQTLGRITRKSEDKVALFINLVSKDTIEERWVRNKTASVNNVRWINNLNQIN